MIYYLPVITRHMLHCDREARFVFGDNHARVGLAGQAAEMRCEPNAIGIRTKWWPSMKAGSFFSDDDKRCEELIKTDLALVKEALAGKRKVYVPSAGLGTGLSQLPTRAPKLYAMLYTEFAFNMEGEKCPWPMPTVNFGVG